MSTPPRTDGGSGAGTDNSGVRTRAVLSAGTNLGDRAGYLRSVVEGFGTDVVAVSSVYATAPWGGVAQPDFYNITLIVEGARTPRDWLDAGVALEHAADRVREKHWGPRTLDVDVITVTDLAAGAMPVISDDPVLTLPHPHAAQRAFVLVPWLEIDPDAVLPTAAGPRRVDDLIAALPADERVGVRVVGEQALGQQHLTRQGPGHGRLASEIGGYR
ncbi:MAG: 2-amino-4-hydroxy-6-hydroxymethyldihydropteridine diphosphokinase [Gordonia sp. (in: high G+C Gram-positive bacteria)]